MTTHHQGQFGLPRQFRPRRQLAYGVLVVAGLLLLAGSWSLAQPAATSGDKPAAEASQPANEPGKPLRLFEQDPYDWIRFKDDKEIKVQPLNLKGRRLPENPRASDKLIVRTLDDPDTEYEVVWRDIVEIKLFEQLILDEAEKLVAAEQFNEAYDYYLYLERHHPKLPGLDASLQKYLFAEAQAWQRGGQYDQALAMLNELYARNPNYEGLGAALDTAAGKLIEKEVDAEKYAAARQLVQALASKHSQSPVAAQWTSQLQEQARQGLRSARDDLEAERFREAADAARQTMRVWPLDEARQIWAEAHRRFPRVVVGVTLPGGRQDNESMVDWAARRSARLFNRKLLEFQGYGPQGGQYQCPVGQIERLDLGLRLSVRLRPNTPWSSGEGVLTGHDVARRLLAMADPAHPAYRRDWSELLAAVAVPDLYEVDVELRRAHVHPDGMLQTALRRWSESAENDPQAPSIGPYVVDSVNDERVTYLANERYFAASSTQPKEIVERYFPQARKGIAALRNGDLGVLDRILPWEVAAMREEKRLVVEPYAVPTIHCLVPNQDKPFLARRSFRRGLLYGIHRQQILAEQLTRGNAELGRLVSGPLPRGSGIDDPLGYAYNEDVPLRPWNPYLARTLLNVARVELAPAADKREDKSSAAKKPDAAGKASEDKQDHQTELPPLPSLVLAHPPHDVARVACRAIQRQWKLLGLDVTLKETSPQSPATVEGDWDLLFVELAMWEPILDARRLLGSGGLVRHASPYMDQALRELELAEDWKRARQRLLEVHRLAHDDLDIIPLWQITEHFAYHKGLEGVGSRPAMLYQNIESWHSPPWFSEDAP
jgi:tetratricopeptide (TPR) repeat protein